MNGTDLITADGRDLYLRYHERVQTGTPRESGMAIFDGEGPLSDIAFAIDESRPTPDRTYRWPTCWQAGFSHRGTRWTLHTTTDALEEVADWPTVPAAAASRAGPNC